MPSPDAPPPARLRDVVRAVLWSFLGIRKGWHMQHDTGAIRPHQVVIVGVMAAALLVVFLVIVVRVIVHVAGA